MNVIETIADLRRDERAQPFWLLTARLVHASKWILATGWQLGDCGKDLPLDRTEIDRLFKWMTTLQNTDRTLTHDDVLVRSDNWRPKDGTHKAAAAYALDLPVPATVVEIPTFEFELYFHGIWKWRTNT